jgi:hypothetical protein
MEFDISEYNPSTSPIPEPPGCLPDYSQNCKATKDGTPNGEQGNCCNNNVCMGSASGPVSNGICIPNSTFSAYATGIQFDSGSTGWTKPPDVCPNEICETAIGNIETSSTGFMQAIMSFVLSISGGIAVLLIIISGYRMIISQGNPENLKNARDQLTAAIVGLLFVIFSLVILQVIGVNILGLPGFSP